MTKFAVQFFVFELISRITKHLNFHPNMCIYSQKSDKSTKRDHASRFGYENNVFNVFTRYDNFWLRVKKTCSFFRIKWITVFWNIFYKQYFKKLEVVKNEYRLLSHGFFLFHKIITVSMFNIEHRQQSLQWKLKFADSAKLKYYSLRPTCKRYRNHAWSRHIDCHWENSAKHFLEKVAWHFPALEMYIAGGTSRLIHDNHRKMNRNASHYDISVILFHIATV